jgi:hypothetical protein
MLMQISPFIFSLQLECAVLLGRERRGHVHDGVVFSGCRRSVLR